MSTLDQNFVNIFLEEAAQTLEGWEQACLQLENNANPETIQLLFRLAHNLKGSSFSVGLTEFGKFVHQVEELLTKLKNNTLEVNQDIVGVLLDVETVLRNWISQLLVNPEALVETESVVSRVVALASGQVVTSASSANSDEPPSFEAMLANAKAGDIVFSDEITLPPLASSAPEPAPALLTAAPAVKTASASAETKKPTAAAKANAPAAGGGADDFIRVKLSKLDELIQLVGELVVNQNILLRHDHLGTTTSEEGRALVAQLSKIIKETQEVSFALRMVPLEQTFQKMQRIVRDLSSSQNKQIDFETYGSDVELDKTVMERLGDPLTHLIRNAIDHGIEPPEDRESVGKNPKARVKLGAKLKEDVVEISISDDGRGLNADKLRQKAIEKNLIRANMQLTPAQCYDLIFLPGFSTKETVTDVSGRGVGMDVVKRALVDMKGDIKISTVLGKGTEFQITLPLSLSIVRAVICKIGDQRFAVPTSQLIEIINEQKHKVLVQVGKTRVVNLRGEVLPVFPLRGMLRYKGSDDPKYFCKQAFVVMHNGKKVMLEVDEIEDEQSIVLKKLNKELQGLPGVFAGAVLSTGEPALVLNPSEFVEGRTGNVA